jgi:transposase InsO family protein
MLFPIRRIQTNRGQEFFAYQVQDQRRDWRIKFRPIRPRSPHLNRKVERVQRSALEEFWSAIELDDPAVADRFAEWHRFYNADRPYSSAGGRTRPNGRNSSGTRCRLIDVISAAYDQKREWLHEYRWDMGPLRPR